MAITVLLEDHTGNISRQARIDERATVAQLIPAIITALRLPIDDNARRPITYHLNHQGHRLLEYETLTVAGVSAGETLKIIPTISGTIEEIGEDSDDDPDARSVAIQLSERLFAQLPNNLPLYAEKETLIRADQALLPSGKDPEGWQKQIAGSIQESRETPPPPPGFALLARISEGENGFAHVVWSPDGHYLATSFYDGTLRIWEIKLKRVVLHRTFFGHIQTASSLAWSPDSQLLVASYPDQSCFLWNISTKHNLRTLVADLESAKTTKEESLAQQLPLRIGLPGLRNATIEELIQEPRGRETGSVAWSPIDPTLLAQSAANAIWIWDMQTYQHLRILIQHTETIHCLAWSPNGRMLVSGGGDKCAFLWNTRTWESVQTLSIHKARINHVAWAPDSNLFVTSSDDCLVCVWDSRDAWPLRLLEGHRHRVIGTAFSANGRFLASQSIDGTTLLWRTDIWEQVAQLSGDAGSINSVGLAFHPHLLLLAVASRQLLRLWNIDSDILINALNTREGESTIQYVSAKVVLIGDTGVGKSGLSLALAGIPFVPTHPTHSRHIRQFSSILDQKQRERQEIYLWDFAGQPGYRLIHQMRLNMISTALIVFHPKSEVDPLAGVTYWNRALRQEFPAHDNTVLPLRKFLVAAKMDLSGATVSKRRIDVLMHELELDTEAYFQTSAKTEQGISALSDAIHQSIQWGKLLRVTSTAFFQEIKEFLQDTRRKKGLILSKRDDLYHLFLKDSPYQTNDTLFRQFKICLELAEAQDIVYRFRFYDLILLRPELLDAYAADLINEVKKEPDEMGWIEEAKVYNAEFSVNQETRLPDRGDERLLLSELVRVLVGWEIAILEHPYLVFPGQYTRLYPDLAIDSSLRKTIIFRFKGAISHIYCRLVVRLMHHPLFQKESLWENVAIYTSAVGGTYGLSLKYIDEGHGELTLFFNEEAREDLRYYFDVYIQERLKNQDIPCERERIYTCPGCGADPSSQQVQAVLKLGRKWLRCPVCGKRIQLLDGIDRLQAIVPSLTEEMEASIENQKKYMEMEIILQGKVATGHFDVVFYYSREDAAEVHVISEYLKLLGILPWLEDWDRQPGQNRLLALEKILRQVKKAAIFVGMNGRVGREINQDIALFQLFARQGGTIIPIILRSYKNFSAFPDWLNNRKWIDFTSTNPIPEQLFYRAIIEESTTQLQTMISEVPMQAEREGRGRAVILTALGVEYNAVRNHLQDVYEDIYKGTIYERGDFIEGERHWSVTIVQITPGNANAALEAERAIEHFNPHIILFVGVAGGLKDVEPGDVVAATRVYGYESGKAKRATFHVRPDVGESGYPLVQRARAEARKDAWLKRIKNPEEPPHRSPQALVGPIAAGSKVLASSCNNLFRFLQRNYNDALAIEMEGRGFLEAAHANHQTLALVVRGISDLLDDKAELDKQGYQVKAARHASAFAFEMLAQFALEDTYQTQQAQRPAEISEKVQAGQKGNAASKKSTLSLIDVDIQENDDAPMIDLTLYNTGTQVVFPTRARIDVLDVGIFHHCKDDQHHLRSFIPVTRTYAVELSPDLKGRSVTTKIAHQLLPGGADRFQLVFQPNTDDASVVFTWYYINVALLFGDNTPEITCEPLLISVPPARMYPDVWEYAQGARCVQENREVLSRMARLAGKKSRSVDNAIRTISLENAESKTAPYVAEKKAPSPTLIEADGDTVRAPHKVFISYNHTDKRWLERLHVHLKPIEQKGIIDLWDDTKIAPGDPWKAAILHALETAKVAVTLVSADFLASDFISEYELPKLLSRASSKGTIIIPIVVSACLFADSELSIFRAANDPDHPLSGMTSAEQEQVLVNVAKVIRKRLVNDEL
jgi:WD40 repeat protein/nucleoside phosphorylase